jgi:RimJ/RimL family protein N-acetyltransferase
MNARVEIGCGLIPAARGQGYAGEALFALMAVAGEHHIAGFRADTTHANIASQCTIAHAGFEQVASDDELLHYEWYERMPFRSPVSGRMTGRLSAKSRCP